MQHNTLTRREYKVIARVKNTRKIRVGSETGSEKSFPVRNAGHTNSNLYFTKITVPDSVESVVSDMKSVCRPPKQRKKKTADFKKKLYVLSVVLEASPGVWESS
jgi:hypothetical protein